MSNLSKVHSHFKKIYRFAIFSTKISELIHVNKIRWEKNQTEFNNSIMPKCFHLFAQSSLILQGRNNVHWIWKSSKVKTSYKHLLPKKEFSRTIKHFSLSEEVTLEKFDANLQYHTWKYLRVIKATLCTPAPVSRFEIFFEGEFLFLFTFLVIFVNKVRIFWKTHKIWKNLPHGFDKSADLLSKCQNHEKDFFSNYVCLSKSPNFII